MKLSDVKDKIDGYFATVKLEDVIERFVDLGYEFEDIQPEYSVYVFYNHEMERVTRYEANGIDVNSVENCMKNGKTLVYSFNSEWLPSKILSNESFDTDTISKTDAVAA